MKIQLKTIPMLIAVSVFPLHAFALEGGHELEFKARGIYFNNDEFKSPGNTSNNRSEQSAVGAELNYKSPYLGGKVGFDASVYSVMALGQSGPQKANLLEIDNGNQLKDSYTTLAQAYVKFNHDGWITARYGRQINNSLLLKSTTTRAVADTFSGAALEILPLTGVKLYGAVYNEWRTRSSGEFVKFRTESSAANPNAGRIDYVGIVGAKYDNGQFDATAEYLSSKNYLTKAGVVLGYKIPVGKNTLRVSGGAFNARDGGDLFVCGAESELDCTGSGRLNLNSNAYYLDADFKIENLTLGVAAATFDGMWIEDNFAVNSAKSGSLTSDHGTNPFPTSASLGPDLTSNGETVYSGRVSYDWKVLVPGLKTSYKYAKGSGAKKSHIDDVVRGDERYHEATVSYDIPFVKNLNVRYVYFDYSSNTNEGSIKGLVRADWTQHRVYLDYSYKF